MNVKIRPQWVISLVVLVLMFIGARIYVGQAIQSETQSPRDAAAQERTKRANPAPPPPVPRPAVPDQRGLVLRPLAQVSAVAEAMNDEERATFYANAKRDAAAVTEAIAAQIPMDERERILEQYANAVQSEDAAPVKAELSKLHADLKVWFAKPMAKPQPEPAEAAAPAPAAPEPAAP